MAPSFYTHGQMIQQLLRQAGPFLNDHLFQMLDVLSEYNYVQKHRSKASLTCFIGFKLGEYAGQSIRLIFPLSSSSSDSDVARRYSLYKSTPVVPQNRRMCGRITYWQYGHRWLWSPVTISPKIWRTMTYGLSSRYFSHSASPDEYALVG